MYLSYVNVRGWPSDEWRTWQSACFLVDQRQRRRAEMVVFRTCRQVEKVKIRTQQQQPIITHIFRKFASLKALKSGILLATDRGWEEWWRPHSFAANEQGRREVKMSPVQVTISPPHPQLGFPKSILALQYRATCFHGPLFWSWVPVQCTACTPLSVALLTNYINCRIINQRNKW